MVTTWTDDPTGKAVPCKAQHINELRQAVEAALPTTTTVPWGRGNRVDSSTNIQAQHLLDLRTGVGQVWGNADISAGPMLWTESVPGAGALGQVLRASHVDDVRRWFNTSETGVANYQFPRVRPLLFGINPSWAEWQNQPAAYSNEQMIAKIRAAGATCVRSGIDWADIEPNPPVNGVHTYYWNAKTAPGAPPTKLDYEGNVQLALEYGLAWVADVGTAPHWASGSTDPHNPMPPDSAHVADFQAFVTAVAQHFSGRIRHYEFVNEPDQGGSWTNPNPAAYVPLLQAFYRAIKAVDPNAWVSTGAVANFNTGPGGGRAFISGIYSNGGRAYFDAMAGHPYATPDVDTAGLAWLRSTMDGAGDTYKPIWVTEYGGNVSVGEQNQAAYLQDSLNDFVGLGSVTIATFQLIADTPTTAMGLLTSDLVRSRLAYGTFSSYQKPTT